MSSGDPGAMPVVTLDRRHGGIDITHVFKNHNGGLSLYHPADPPWEVRHGETGPEPLYLNEKQARSLRDQLNAMDLGTDEKKES